MIYRANVIKNDRREEICKVFNKIYPNFNADPETIICDGFLCEDENAMLLDPNCRARKCVNDNGYINCGYCEKYPCEIYPGEPTQEELVQQIDIEKRWTWEDEKLMEAYRCKRNMDEFRKNR